MNIQDARRPSLNKHWSRRLSLKDHEEKTILKEEINATLSPLRSQEARRQQKETRRQSLKEQEAILTNIYGPSPEKQTARRLSLKEHERRRPSQHDHEAVRPSQKPKQDIRSSLKDQDTYTD